MANLLSLTVILYSCATAIFHVALSWALVYRRADFKTTRKEMEKCHAQLAAIEGQAVVNEHTKSQVSTLNRKLEDLSVSVMKRKFLAGLLGFLIMIVSSRIFSKYIHGAHVAFLPLPLPQFVFRAVQRGLGPDKMPDEIPASLLMTLSSYSLKAAILRLLGQIDPPTRLQHSGIKKMMNIDMDEANTIVVYR